MYYLCNHDSQTVTSDNCGINYLLFNNNNNNNNNTQYLQFMSSSSRIKVDIPFYLINSNGEIWIIIKLKIFSLNKIISKLKKNYLKIYREWT